MLNAESILNYSDVIIEKLEVPEWGGEVGIKTMSGTERDSWELYASQELSKKNNANVRAKLASLCLCDEKGNRLFTDQQAIALGEKSAVALNRIYEKAMSINKLTSEDIEQLEKN